MANKKAKQQKTKNTGAPASGGAAQSATSGKTSAPSAPSKAPSSAGAEKAQKAPAVAAQGASGSAKTPQTQAQAPSAATAGAQKKAPAPSASNASAGAKKTQKGAKAPGPKKKAAKSAGRGGSGKSRKPPLPALEKALSDDDVIDQALENLRKETVVSTLPDPDEGLLEDISNAELPDNAQMTGVFAVLDRAQTAMANAEERLMAEALEPPKSQRKLQIGLIIGGAVVLLVAGVFVWYQVFGRVSVPDMIGMSQSDAVAALNDNHLKVGQLVEKEAPGSDPGTIIDQDPMVDVKVARGAAVVLTVATTSGQVNVPSVLDGTPADASTTLTDARLAYQEVKTFSDTVPPGSIVGQLPVAGTSAVVGSKVLVLVSQGSLRSLLPVPKVLGLSRNDASKLLNDQGFVPLFYYAQTQFGTVNEAVTQTPASTGTALPGSIVMVLISQGNSSNGLLVPDVTGQDEAAAKKALQDAGFNVDVRRIATSSGAAGKVVSQTPQAKDTRLSAGDTVGLLVSIGSDSAVKVPDLLNVRLTDAQDRLRGLGLNPVIVTQPKGQNTGKVIQQFPAAGTAYQLGLPVLLYAPQNQNQSQSTTAPL